MNQVKITPIFVDKSFIVPVAFSAEDSAIYTLYMGDMIIRYFSKGVLPDDIKWKLAMVMTVSQDLLYSDIEVIENPVVVFSSRITDLYPEEFKSIGWKVSPSFYCVAVDPETFYTLRGTK